MPIRSMMTNDVEKFTYLNIFTSTIGSFSNHSQTTRKLKPTTAMMISVAMKCEPSQSSSCPLSSTI